MSGFRNLNEVPMKETLALLVNQLIVTLSRACDSATCGTHCTCGMVTNLVAAWTSQLFPVYKASIAFVEQLIRFVMRWLHEVEHIVAPIHIAMIVHMFIATHVAEAYFTRGTVFQ